MQLTENRPEEQYYIHSLGPDAIQVVEDRYSRSLILSPFEGVRDWPVASVDALETHHLEPILEPCLYDAAPLAPSADACVRLRPRLPAQK